MKGLLNVLDLFTGYSGFQLGLKLAGEIVGFEPRTVCYVEREIFAVANLVAKIEQSLLDDAPIWSDVTTFDGKPYRGKVDCITGGIPCQPFSLAGKQAGLADERWLWDDVYRILIETGSPLIFIENVPNIVNHGLLQILEGLAANGYDAQWDCYSASEIGAPHRRERFFLLAYTEKARIAWKCEIEQSKRTECAGDVGNTNKDRLQNRNSIDTGSRNDSVCRLQPFPPAITGEWDNVPPHLKPAIRRVVDGNSEWMDGLALCGNGVVPGVVAVAFIELAERAGILI